jgi:NADH:ubiquinone oxidoreductase subunit 6 (subunit J)
MAELFFFIAGIGAVAGAIGVVVLRNPLFSVLALVSHLLCLALLFLLLRAEFIAAAQVIIYAGAVMVLYVFVVSYVGGADEVIPLTGGGRAQRLLAVAFGGAIFAELAIAVLGTGLKALSGEGAPYSPGPQAFGSRRPNRPVIKKPASGSIGMSQSCISSSANRLRRYSASAGS